MTLKRSTPAENQPGQTGHPPAQPHSHVNDDEGTIRPDPRRADRSRVNTPPVPHEPAEPAAQHGPRSTNTPSRPLPTPGELTIERPTHHNNRQNASDPHGRGRWPGELTVQRSVHRLQPHAVASRRAPRSIDRPIHQHADPSSQPTADRSGRVDHRTANSPQQPSERIRPTRAGPMARRVDPPMVSSPNYRHTQCVRTNPAACQLADPSACRPFAARRTRPDAPVHERVGGDGASGWWR